MLQSFLSEQDDLQQKKKNICLVIWSAFGEKTFQFSFVFILVNLETRRVI